MTKLHHKVAAAFEEIDAAVFNGDTFDDPDNRDNALEYIQRWRDRFGEMIVEDDAADEVAVLHVPPGGIPGELRESARAVLHSHAFVVARSNVDAIRPEDRHLLVEIDPARLDSLVDEIGKNGAQRVHMLAINHELDAQEKPDDWSPHVRDLEAHVRRKDWIGAIRVLARMTVQAAIRAEDESP